MRRWIDRKLDRILPRKPGKHELQIDSAWQPRSNPLHRGYAYREVQPDLNLEVFWKVQHPFLGRGPGAIVYLGNRSMMKFDCLGAQHGHFHIHELERFGHGRIRVFFREQSVEEQIEHSVFELVWNFPSYLLASRFERARKFPLDTIALEAGARWMGDQMIEFARSIPEIEHRGETVTRPPPELGITGSRPHPT